MNIYERIEKINLHELQKENSQNTLIKNTTQHNQATQQEQHQSLKKNQTTR